VADTAGGRPNPRFSAGNANLPIGAKKTANREIGVPGKNQNGEPGGSPFQRFCLRRHGGIQRR